MSDIIFEAGLAASLPRIWFLREKLTINPDLQYDIADHLARLLAKMPAWKSPSAEEEVVGRCYENQADFLAER